MITDTEIVKGCFFLNKKGKVVEVYGFTVESENLSIWTRESYLNSKNEIKYHQELYFIEDINHIEIDKEWLDEFNFKKSKTFQYYELLKKENSFLIYNLIDEKLGVIIKENSEDYFWIDCRYVNKLQVLINFFSQI